jgi:hypothetical protein
MVSKFEEKIVEKVGSPSKAYFPNKKTKERIETS